MKIGIILSTTREKRVSDQVGNWLLKESKTHSKNNYEIVDLREYHLPLLGYEDTNNAIGPWVQKLEELDGYIVVLAEYNHSIPGVLKNALDYVGQQMANKPAAIVSYGAAGGARSTEHLRGIFGQTNTADISTHILLSLFYDFENFATFKPLDLHAQNLQTMFTNLDKWAAALKTIR